MENTLEEFEVKDNQVKDKRSFVEKAFFNANDEELVLKNIVIVDALKGDPEAFPSDRIMLMRNYKSGIERGRRDPLKGEDVIAILTDKGPYMIPLDEAEKFAMYLYSVANSLKKKVES